MTNIVFKGQYGNLEYKTKYSSGADLCAQEFIELEPNCTAIVPTGVYLVDDLEAEDTLLNISVCPRSGLSAKGILCHHGTIDIDYRDEIKVILTNLSKETYLINRGARIAQLVVYFLMREQSIKVCDVQRTGGFGSTGV